MKSYLIFLIIVFATSSTFGQNTTVQQGNNCFNEGNYTCALAKYGDALITASSIDKEFIQENINMAQQCLDYKRKADKEFANKNYSLAKIHYESLILLNDKDIYAKSQIEKCNDFLTPPIYLSVSKESLSLSSSGANDYISVTTNANSYSVSGLPYWITIEKYRDYFIVKCAQNNSTTQRSVHFTVTAGGKTQRINITQSGRTPTETTLSVSRQSIPVEPGGGVTIIDVTTNAKTYSISQLPSWGKLNNKHSTWFSLSFEPNRSVYSRSGTFKVTADGKEVLINITQSGSTNTTSKTVRTPNTISSGNSKRSCFNCPGIKNTFGITVGYIQSSEESIFGLQAGLKIEPLFNYGFGLNTGINFEYYQTNNHQDIYGEVDYNFYALNIPLHAEYRIHFSRNLSVFGYGGVGASLISDSSLEEFQVPITFDFGGGIRLNRVQFNIGQQTYYTHLIDSENLLLNERFFSKIIFSISLMF